MLYPLDASCVFTYMENQAANSSATSSIKKKRWIIVVAALYLLVGSMVMLMGSFPRDSQASDYIISGATVVIAWPFFVIGKIFING